jgi:hypothetical protein
MSLSVKKGTFVKITTTGNQSVTGVGFTPKALILYATALTADGFASNIVTGFGMASGSAAGNNRTITTSSTNAEAATTACGRGYQAKVLSMIATTGSMDSECGLVSFDADGFTVNWSTSSANAYEIHYIAFGGTDLTNALVKDESCPAATGNQAFTGYGFKPDFLLFITDYGSGTGFATTDARFGIGAAISPTKRWAASIFASSGSAVGSADNEFSAQSNVACITIDDFVTAMRADHVSMDADGYTLNFSAVSSGRSFAALALKGGSYDLGHQAKPTGGAPASQQLTGSAFKPKLVLLASYNIAASTSIANGAKLSIGAMDASNQGSTWVEAKFRSSPSVSNQSTISTAALQLATGPSTADATGAFSSFNSDGWTLTWNPNNGVAADIGWISFGDSAADTVTESMAFKYAG